MYIYTTRYIHVHTHTYIHVQKRGNLKGQVDLTKVKAIEKVQDGQFDKPSFQVSHYRYLRTSYTTATILVYSRQEKKQQLVM